MRPVWEWALLAAVVIWSGWSPVHPTVWFFEALPAIGLLAALVWSDRYWPCTMVVRYLLCAGVVLMLVGAHYTYAGMPLFSWLQESLAWSRNHYDRLGHLFQGAVPALLVREMMVRQGVVRQSVWLSGLSVCAGLALSVCWELVEWAAVVVAGGSPDVYLNFQGDPWDTQADMACAGLGALLTVGLLGGLHDRQLRQAGLLLSVSTLERGQWRD